jgi:Flp pilus assembly protein CpaB
MKVGTPPPTPRRDGGSPLSSRRGSATAAIVAGVLAAVVLIVFLSNYRSNTGSANSTVTVLAARNLLPQNSSGDSIAANGLFQAIQVKRSQLKPGALTDPGTLRGKVTTHQLFAGEQITASDLRGKEQRGVIDQLGGNQRAIAVAVDATHGLAGNLRDGDRVDVYGIYSLKGINTQGAGNPDGQVARELLKNVSVLRAPTGKEGNVVLNVPEEAAGKLALTADFGKVYLSLRPSAGAQSLPTDTTDTAQTIILGASSQKVTQALDALGVRTNSQLIDLARRIVGGR